MGSDQDNRVLGLTINQGFCLLIGHDLSVFQRRNSTPFSGKKITYIFPENGVL